MRALKIMRLVEDRTPKATVLYAMWLLENRQLSLEFNIYRENDFVKITEVLLEIFENDVDIYWMAKGFYEYTEEIKEEIGKLIDLTHTLLEKEDNVLATHLKNIKVWNELPLDKWYGFCFAKILPEPALIRIWDKICGGSIKILVFVMIFILTTLRRNILRANDLKSLMDCLDSVRI